MDEAVSSIQISFESEQASKQTFLPAPCLCILIHIESFEFRTELFLCCLDAGRGVRFGFPGTHKKFPRKDNRSLCELLIISKTSIKMDLKMGFAFFGNGTLRNGNLDTPGCRLSISRTIPLALYPW